MKAYTKTSKEENLKPTMASSNLIVNNRNNYSVRLFPRLVDKPKSEDRLVQDTEKKLTG